MESSRYVFVLSNGHFLVGDYNFEQRTYEETIYLKNVKAIYVGMNPLPMVIKSPKTSDARFYEIEHCVMVEKTSIVYKIQVPGDWAE